MREPFSDVLVGSLANMTGRLLEVVPRLAAFGVFVGLGALWAWALAGIVQALLRAAQFDRAAIRWGLWRLLQMGGIRRSPSAVLAGVVGAAIFGLAALLALDAVEAPGAGSVTGIVLGFLPRGLGACLLIILGVLAGRLGEFAARLIWARRAWKNPDLAGVAARWGVRAAGAGFALALVGAPPMALLVAVAVPGSGVLLGFTLGIAQAARAVAHRAAIRWVRSLAPGAAASQATIDEHPEGEPVAAANGPEPLGGRLQAFAHFRASKD